MTFDLVKYSSRNALPFPARDLYDLQVSGYRDGKVILSIEMPEPMLHAFTALLDSLCDSFRFLKFKAKVAKAQAAVVDPAAIEKHRIEHEAFIKLVLACYDNFITTGHTQREAFKAAKEFLNKKRGFNLVAYDVELIARQAGRLSKRKNKIKTA